VELVFYASLVSFGALFGLLLINDKLNELMSWSYRDYIRSAWLGLLNPFLYYLILFKAYFLLPAQEAQPLNFTWPIVLVLLSAVLLRQPINTWGLLAMAVSFSGVVVISTRGHLLAWQVTHGLGVTLALTSTVIWAFYWLYSIKDNRDPNLRLCLNFAFGFLYTALYRGMTQDVQWPSWIGLAGAAYVGLFEMGITFMLWLKALKLSRTTAEISHLIYLSPFLSLLVIHVVIGEAIYPSTFVGLVLIVSGILAQHYGHRQRNSG
jgi:drug/metabolite transporter (DMT)-like permease